MRYIILVLCLLFSSSALAYAPPIPQRYDYPYLGTLYLTWADSATVHRACKALDAEGCVYGKTYKKCYVVINEAFKPYAAWHDYLFRHEQAHCNGWPWWHPY